MVVRSLRRFPLARARLTPPVGLERDYRVMLTKRVEALAKRMKAQLGLRADANTGGEVKAAVAAVRKKWQSDKPVSKLRGELVGTAKKVEEQATRKTARAVETIAPVDVSKVAGEAGGLTKMHTAWAKENARFIRNMETAYLDDVARFVAEAVEKGSGATAALQSRLGISRRRAALIARNEIGTLNAQVTRARNEELGIRRFRWVDSGDDKVRPLHEDLNGQVFDYPGGHPTEGLPGQPVNCRCSQEPVL